MDSFLVYETVVWSWKSWILKSLDLSIHLSKPPEIEVQGKDSRCFYVALHEAESLRIS